MRHGFLLSVAFHAGIVLFAIFGLPVLSPPEPLEETPLFVDVVEIADIINAPPPSPQKQEKAPEKAPEPPTPPKVEPVAQPEPPAPKPEPVPEPPKPEIAALPPEPAPKAKPEPEPEPEPKAEPKPEPKPKPEAKAEPEAKPEATAAAAKLKKKPKPPEAFDTASLLKTLEQVKKTQKTEEPKPQEKKAPQQDDFLSTMKSAIKSEKPRPFDASKPITMTEEAALKKIVVDTVVPCWNVQAGAKDGANLAVLVRLSMRPDGMVNSASIEDQARYLTDPFYRTAAEAARRAVLNPKCNPIKLPPDKYDHWRDIVINFDPKEIL